MLIISRATLDTKFLSQTDRQTFSRSSPGHPKTGKSIKNCKKRICTKPILYSIYIEESKNSDKLSYYHKF